MDVLKGNFEEAAALLEQLLPTAAFVAIDAEMTGIYIDKDSAPCISDNCEVSGNPFLCRQFQCSCCALVCCLRRASRPTAMAAAAAQLLPCYSRRCACRCAADSTFGIQPANRLVCAC